MTDACLDRGLDTRPIHTRIISYFFKGADFYWQNVQRWLGLAREKVVVPVQSPTGQCQQVSDCNPGMACLNACTDGNCDVLIKKCMPHEATSIEVPQAYASCGVSNLCAAGTTCTRTCPAGVPCDITHRCLPPVKPLGSCSNDVECVSACGREGFPAAGLVGLRAECRAGACGCAITEIDPKLVRAACPQGSQSGTLLCPTSTTPACAESGRETCLLAPAYGGSCLETAHCSGVTCPTGSASFCDTDRRCRCRSSAAQTISCTTVADCSNIVCEADEEKVCTSNGCACARTTQQEISCTQASQCPANCAAGYEAACIDSVCACRQESTTTTRPVSCTTVAECSAVQCPAGYDKGCLNQVCSCSREIPQ